MAGLSGVSGCLRFTLMETLTRLNTVLAKVDKLLIPVLIVLKVLTAISLLLGCKTEIIKMNKSYKKRSTSGSTSGIQTSLNILSALSFAPSSRWLICSKTRLVITSRLSLDTCMAVAIMVCNWFTRLLISSLNFSPSIRLVVWFVSCFAVEL